MLIAPLGMERIRSGRAYCAICHEVIRPDEDALVSPDFLADEADPFWRFSGVPLHRACFLVWDRRKAYIARYNRTARRWPALEGSYPHMTSEGEIVTVESRHRGAGLRDCPDSRRQ